MDNWSVLSILLCMRSFFVIIGMAVIAACSETLAPMEDVVPGAKRVAITQDIRDRWAHMVACSGIDKPIDQYRFYSVPLDSNGSFRNGKEMLRTDGAYFPRHHAIVIADGTWGHAYNVLEHEIMHALIDPIDGHPPEWFLDGPCGLLE